MGRLGGLLEQVTLKVKERGALGWGSRGLAGVGDRSQALANVVSQAQEEWGRLGSRDSRGCGPKGRRSTHTSRLRAEV